MTQEELKRLLSYNEKSGVFTWNIARGNRSAGSIAGNVTWSGYVEIKINKKVHYAHRLAWLYMTGNYPKQHTDHVDGNRSNNEFSNLREATNGENSQNIRVVTKKNTSGFLGVQRSLKKWKATISVNKRKIHIGTFDSPEGAYAAYVEAKRKNHSFCTL